MIVTAAARTGLQEAGGCHARGLRRSRPVVEGSAPLLLLNSSWSPWKTIPQSPARYWEAPGSWERIVNVESWEGGEQPRSCWERRVSGGPWPREERRVWLAGAGVGREPASSAS